MNSSKDLSAASAAAAAASGSSTQASSSSSSVWDAGGRSGDGASAGAAELFSAALQRLGNTRGATVAVETEGASSSLSASVQNRECDSDDFLNSDEDNRDERDEQMEEEMSDLSAPSSSSSSDVMWGTFTGGEASLPLCDDDDAAGSSNDGCEDGVLFVPDPIFDLTSLQQKAVMPCLTQDQLPVGATVWVVDEDDVATQLTCNFSASYPPVCNGRLSGEVVRHTGNMTLVRFRSKASDLYFTLSLPTSCLSLQPIEPYDSVPHHCDSYGLGSGAYGMLGPRAACREPSELSGHGGFVGHYLFEAMPAYDFEKVRGTTLEKAQEAFFGGTFEKALTSVNEYIDAQSKSPPASADAAIDSSVSLSTSGDASPKAAALVDALILRSRILVFLERYLEALDDAQRCVQLEPRWVRGYLSLARVHCGLGQFSEAAAATAHACIMLPYSLELERIRELNSHMHYLQSQLRAEKASCYLVLDCYYRKRLRVSAPLTAETVLCTDVTPIVSTHSVFVAKEPPHRCPVCFRVFSASEQPSSSTADPSSAVATAATANTPSTAAISPPLSSPGGTEMEEEVEYCSTECTQRASLYRPLELKHRAPLEQVRSLILSKGAVTLNVLPLEMAAMTVRLFLMVITIHRRLSAKRRLEDTSRRNIHSAGMRPCYDKTRTWPDVEAHVDNSLANLQCPSPSPPLRIETSLRRLGVYPLCTEPIANNKLEELKIVYDALTADFKAEDRATFSYEILSQLYAYVSAYFTPVDLHSLQAPDSTGSSPAHQTVFYLPHYVGCIETAKIVSYTAASRLQRPREEGVPAEDERFAFHLRDHPARDGAPAVSWKQSGGTRNHASNSGVSTFDANTLAAASKDEANCMVRMGSGPALLELVTVAPVNRERKLHCIPVTIALDSDVA
ncbi:hypothetical protein GH5_02803 [Leishmania sp. Ghana 2012 LV757]|uniref:hypothetical protein n=1 Tax=Leishmania sp. Ghana 2012 LV757 TaxID=2803181 RepID=UPI001B6187B5|nr:hypothetical protein GH5_02803 [Leishmania sp. Ghana 2012 LV757]